MIVGLFAVLYRQELKAITNRLANPPVRRIAVVVLILAAIIAFAAGWRLLT